MSSDTVNKRLIIKRNKALDRDNLPRVLFMFRFYFYIYPYAVTERIQSLHCGIVQATSCGSTFVTKIISLGDTVG